MRKIYKYPFDTTDHFNLNLPAGAEILTVQTQGGQPCIWATVDTGASTEPRRFRVYGTGHPVPERPEQLSYIGTYQLNGGAFVFHLFEVL